MHVFKPRCFVASLAFATLVLAGCATQPTNDTLQALCTSTDLAAKSQRTLLAGGYHAIEKKDLACAERLTAKAQELDPKDPFAALNLGAIYQRTDRIELARAQYEKTIVLQGESKGTENAHVATHDQAKDRSPAAIARQNLAKLSK